LGERGDRRFEIERREGRMERRGEREVRKSRWI
jgi:hypothetical protein